MRNLTGLNGPTFLMSAPCCPGNCGDVDIFTDHPGRLSPCAFQVAWSINPHMKIGATSLEKSLSQHRYFRQALEESGARIIDMPFVHGAYDSVFIKDNAVLKKTSSGVAALLGNPFTKERKKEQRARFADFEDYGISVIGMAKENLEGGDVVIHASEKVAFMGHGFRSSLKAKTELSNFLNVRVVPLELVNPHFYHLDVAFTILSDGTAFVCRDAFTATAWRSLVDEKSISKIIDVSVEDALGFGLNMVEVNDTVVMGSYSSKLMKAMNNLNKKVIVAPLDQFQLAGGSAACLTAPIYDFDQIYANAFKPTSYFYLDVKIRV